jgi:CheY-like chemotaxis protein
MAEVLMALNVPPRARLGKEAHHRSEGVRARTPRAGCMHPCGARDRAMRYPAMSTRTEPVRVLVVDDQPAFREMASALVEATPGFDVVGEAADGESAVRLARELDPELLLVDVRMAGMDGFETARRLDEEGARGVVVLVTSGETRELSPLAHAAPVAALVQKQWLTRRLIRGLWMVHRRR